MTAAKTGPEVNLEVLRSQLAGRLGLVVMIVGGLLAWVCPAQRPFPVVEFGVLIVLVVVGWSVWRLVAIHPATARHLLVWGLNAALLAAMGLFPGLWLPFLGLPLAFIGAILVTGGEFAVLSMTAVLAIGLTCAGVRSYPLAQLIVALILGTALAWLTVRTLSTALEWAWTMQERADRLLKLARDRQGELSSALRSVEITSTILRRTQRELILARQEAENARKMKEQFAANVSHELRTPLNLIVGFSEVMSLSPEVYGDLDWPSTLRQDINQIYRSSCHLLEMIDDVLDLSRYEIAGFTLDKEPTDLGQLIRDTVCVVEGFFRGRPVKLEAKIPLDLPMLNIDRTRIRQVLLNLLNNAQRFTEEGRVRVEARRADGEVMISISDTGSGIPADELPHLFEEFYQMDRSLHRRHGGTGLGLAISKHFVDAHDGRIWVESAEGRESVFTFTLPIPGEHVPLSRLQVDRPLQLPASEERPVILLMDPDPNVAAWIGRHLGEYEVISVRDATQLNERLSLHRPQALVWNTPPGKRNDNGLDIAQSTLFDDDAISASVPIIECSLPSQSWMADNLSVVAYLTKPIPTEQLLQVIGRLGDVHDVLVIDDDRGFCRLVERMLAASERPYHVHRAYGGERGLLALRARKPDVVLLDLGMPDLDGFQVLDEIRQDPDLADTPVILLTATNYVEDALTRRPSQISIRRPGGLRLDDTLRCVRAVLGAFEPRYGK